MPKINWDIGQGQTDGAPPGQPGTVAGYVNPPGFPDINSDGIINQDDVNAAHQFFQTDASHLGSTISPEEHEVTMSLMTFVGYSGGEGTVGDWIGWETGVGVGTSYDWSEPADMTDVSGMQSMPVTQQDLGISTGATGSREELQRMLQSYTGRTSLIQQAQRKKAIFTIDRFDGGLNLNKAPRDLAYWESCQMNELMPSKIGRLVRLGDFVKDWDSSGAAGSTYAMGLATTVTEQENYGLHYFKFTDSITDSSDTLALAGGSPTNYLAYNSCDGGIDFWNFTTGDEVSSMMADNTFNLAFKPVYHSASNRLYVSDANLKKSGGVLTVDDDTHPGSHTAWQNNQTHTNISQTSTDGSGTGLVCDISTDASGYTTFVIVDYGEGYVVDEEITFTDPGNTNNEADLVVASLDDNTKSHVCGIADRRQLFPFDNSGTLTYNITSDSHIFTSQPLYHAPPVKGTGSGQITIVGTQLNESSAIGGQHLAGLSNAHDGSHGIYININFETIDAGASDSDTGWGATVANNSETALGPGTKYYKFYASWLYDDGSETKLTGVSGANNDNDETVDIVKATNGQSSGQYQEMIIKQVYIDGAGIVAALPRVHGARFYYDEVNENGGSLGSDKYLWAELDFRYGFKLQTEFGHWNQFEDDDASADTIKAIQVLGAANADIGTDTGAGGDFGTLSLKFPPRVFTYFLYNLYFPEEIKDDLMWKTSTIGNGLAFIGNIKYDGREYPDTMLYSGAGEVDSGSPYPLWGTFPVDSNRIDIPGEGGEITALKWTKNKVLQFRKNILYVIDVSDVTAPRIDKVYQGMGVHGQWAVTETPYGCAWVNDTGAYAYNGDTGSARSLTIGRLDTEDFIAGQNGTDADKALTKIGYDDRAKMLIIGNWTKRTADGYHYAYSFVTDAWCTWNINANSYTPMSNFVIDHNGYLTGATRSSTNLIVHKWSATPNSTPQVTYVTKDIDMGKPSLDKRFYTLYISFTGGTSQASMYVWFRVNGMEGDDLTNGWAQLATIFDYTNPYGVNQGSAWAASADGSTTLSGEAFIPSDVNHLNSTDTGDVQKLAKINLRHIGDGTSFPDDYFKFARSIQFRIQGTAATTFEINDISLVFKEKRIK